MIGKCSLLFLLLGWPCSALLAETPATSAPPSAASSPAIKHLSAPEAAKTLQAAAAASPAPDQRITVLDVRTAAEFSEAHLKGAVNVDIFSPHFEKTLSSMDRNKTYLVHCASGARSNRSLKTLEKLGFKNLIHLDGGMHAWQEAGLPVETGAASPR